MDYKEKLRQLKDGEDWEKLLHESLLLYEDGNDDRYVIRMIVLAFEKLNNKDDAVPFWEILGRGENQPEEFSKKLITYYQKKNNKEKLLIWTKRLLTQSLRKKDFEAAEDTWMQMIESESIEMQFAREITDKMVALGENERAYTLLDLLLLSLEEKQSITSDAITIAKRMLEIDNADIQTRKRLEGFYRNTYSKCTEIENFLEKANIRRSDDIQDAINLFEKLIPFCPGRYVLHKSWDMGKIKAVDLLFNKIFVDFAAHPNHAIELDLAFKILTPLEEDNFLVLKREKREYLEMLKDKNPIRLIALILKKEDPLSHKRLQDLLKGIVEKEEWNAFLEQAKKGAKSEGIEIKRKGNTYIFSLQGMLTSNELTVIDVPSIKNNEKRAALLVSLARERLTEKERLQWSCHAEEMLIILDFPLKKKVELLFTCYDVIKDIEQLKDKLNELFGVIGNDEKALVISSLPKRIHKKELLWFLAEKDIHFAEEIFLDTKDDWLRAHALKIVEKSGNKKGLFLKLYQTPYKNPLCFLYLVEIIMKRETKPVWVNKPIIFFETVIEFMGKEDAEQKTRMRAKSVFKKFGFDMYRWTLETSSKEEISVLIDIIKKNTNITSTDTITFEKIAESKHPSLKLKAAIQYIYATKISIQKKQKELDRFLKVEIPANSDEIGRAARQGDLSENFDYIAAKEKQRKLINRVNMLKDELSKVHPIEEIAFTEGEVSIGAHVVLEDEKGKEKREVFILGPWDSLPDKEVLSHTAPLAQELIGKKVGELFIDEFSKKTYRIHSVERFGT